MKRPLGITILAVLSFLNVATYATLLALALFRPDALAAVLRALSPGGSGPDIQLRMGRLLPVYYGVLMAFTALIGLGFWKLWNWSRIVVLVMVGVSSVALVAEAATVLRSGSTGGILLWLVRGGLCAFFIWYLTSAKIRVAFGSRKQTLEGRLSHAG